MNHRHITDSSQRCHWLLRMARRRQRFHLVLLRAASYGEPGVQKQMPMKKPLGRWS